MFRVWSLALFALMSSQAHLSQAAAQQGSPTHSPAKDKASKPASRPPSKTQRSSLSIVETIKLTGIETGMPMGDPQCDADGNMYLQNDVDLQSPIHKISLTGEKKAEFLASSSSDLPHLPLALAHSGAFSVTEDGDLYLEVMVSMTEHDLLLFGKDGTYKSKVGLDNGSVWHLKKMAVFASGEILVTGDKWQKAEQNYAPFTAIFSSSGTFLKELSLEDDRTIYESSLGSGPTRPGNIPAIFGGVMAAAADGNIYLMRRLSPAVVYAISPGGEVVRRFTVDSGDSGAVPSNMRIAGDSIAIEFGNRETGKKLFKVVDLEGKERAIYDWPEFDGEPLWLSLCYLQNPERFVFLDHTKDDTPVLRVAEPH